MTATVLPRPTTATTATTAGPTRARLWAPGLVAGVGAALATITVAGVASAVGVPLEVAGEAIPLLGFGTTTLFCVVIGLLIASAVRRWARRPATTWVRVATVLTLLSFVPDITADATLATQLVLVLTHVVAAAIVIPVVADRLD